MRKIHLGGIKLLKECCELMASGNKDDDLLPSVTARMTENQVNMPFLTHLADDGEGRSITTFTTENTFGQMACGCLESIVKSPAAFDSSLNTAVLSIFPHDQKPEVAGRLIAVLAQQHVQPFAFASSHIDARLSSIISSVLGPVFPAISFIPARITTTEGLRLMTSGLNLISIWGVVWPLMPRFT